MAKYNLDWDEARVQKCIKEGRGQGEGRAYKPWLTVRDVPSRGRSTRAFGWKSHRVHHLLSDNETRFFYLLEWSDKVVDIREQYPILDRDLVIDISRNLGIRYPRYRKSRVPYVMSTDFVITLSENGHTSIIARTVKPAKDVEKKRTRDLFKIEEKYWIEQGIDWGIILDSDIPKVLARNIEELHSAIRLEKTEEDSPEELLFMSQTLLERLIKSPGLTIKAILDTFDRDTKRLPGTALSLFRYLLATKRVNMDLNQRINIRNRAHTLSLGINAEKGWVYDHRLFD